MLSAHRQIGLNGGYDPMRMSPHVFTTLTIRVRRRRPNDEEDKKRIDEHHRQSLTSTKKIPRHDHQYRGNRVCMCVNPSRQYRCWRSTEVVHYTLTEQFAFVLYYTN